MMSEPARADERAEQPPSTAGTSAGRAHRWPLRVSLLVIGAVALAAPMVAAEPAFAPVQPTAVAAVGAKPVTEATTTVPAGPTAEEIDQLNRAILTNKLNENAWIEKTKEIEAARAEAARQAAIKAEAARVAAAKQAAARRAVAPPAAQQGTGRCGGDLPPCYVMMRESGGNIRARNPSSSASGKWQFLRSTWAGFGGYAEAWLAPESVQDAKARALWAGGSGCGHWNAC